MRLFLISVALIMSVVAFGQAQTSSMSAGNSVQAVSENALADTVVPNKLSYQGLITTPTGDPLPDGNYELKFEIFNLSASGTALWSETQAGIIVVRGTFSLLLGSVTPLPPIFYQPLWLEITAVSGPGISSPVTFSPRTELASAAFSLGPVVRHANGYYLPSPRLGISKPPIGDFVGLDVFSPNHAVRTRMTSPAYSTGFWADKFDSTEYNYFVLQTAGADRWSIGTMGNDNFMLHNWRTGQQNLTVTNAGNLGIGNTAPVKKLEVNGTARFKDTVLAGSAGGTGAFYLYKQGSNLPTVSLDQHSIYGGKIRTYDTLGSTTARIEPDVSGPGGYMSVSPGFEVDGNYGSTGYTRVSFTGLSSSRFATNLRGDQAVQLPDSSVSALEILNEPGISNSQRTTIVTNSSNGTIIVADSVDITVPSSGYIEVIGGGWLNINHTIGTVTEVWLGINNVGGSQNVYPGLGVVRIPQELPTNASSSYGYPCISRRFYEVTAGSYRYYLNLRFSGGGASAGAGDPYIRATFYPTLYGTSTVISPTASYNPSARTDVSEQLILDQIQISPEERLEQLKAKAAQLKEELESTIKLLDSNGSPNGLDR